MTTHSSAPARPAVAGQPVKFSAHVVELERAPGVVHDLGRVRNVPDLSLDVVVTR
jgi:hypothetical protein